MRVLLIAIILVMSMFLFACSQAEQQVETNDTVEVIEDTTEVIEDTTVVAAGSKALPEPWPQDFLVQEGLEIISEVEAEGNLVVVSNFPKDSEHLGTFDLYDYYYDGNSGWKVPEDMKMTCSATGDAFTVTLGGETGMIVVVGSYPEEDILTLTFSFVPTVIEEVIIEEIEDVEEIIEDSLPPVEEAPVEETTTPGE